MQLKAERLGDEIEISHADFDLAGFHLGKVAAVHAHALGHFELRPAAFIAQFADARAEPDTDVAGHAASMACRLSTTNRL